MYEKSWNLEKPKLQTLAMETPMYGEILSMILYKVLLNVIFLDKAAVPKLPTIAAVTAPVKETILFN